MQIVAIEGLDKSGKATQAKMLKEALEKIGLKVVQSEFHRYDTPTGKMIQDWLYKRYDVDQATIELIMAADKQAQQKWFASLEEDQVDVLILDRYVTSQRTYGHVSGSSHHWIEALIKQCRKPDIEILIELPPIESMNRKGKHGDNDRYESDLQFLRNVQLTYWGHFANRTDCIVDGLLSVEKVHEQIMNVIKDKMEI